MSARIPRFNLLYVVTFFALVGPARGLAAMPIYTLPDLANFVQGHGGYLREYTQDTFTNHDENDTVEVSGYQMRIVQTHIDSAIRHGQQTLCIFNTYAKKVTTYNFDMRDIQIPSESAISYSGLGSNFWLVTLDAAPNLKPIPSPAPSDGAEMRLIDEDVVVNTGGCANGAATVGFVSHQRFDANQIILAFSDYYAAVRFVQMISTAFPRF